MSIYTNYITNNLCIAILQKVSQKQKVTQKQDTKPWSAEVLGHK